MVMYDPMIMAAVTMAGNRRRSGALLRTKRKPSVDLPDKRAKVKAACKQANKNRNRRPK